MDLNGDGNNDLLSGSWPGEIFFFPGKADKSFGPKEKLKDKSGKPINIRGGIQKTKDSISITGDAEFKKDEKGDYAEYNGEKYYHDENVSVSVTGCASALWVSDWNGDGLLDLVVGEIGGSVSVYFNEGTKSQFQFDKPSMLKADDKPISVPHGDSGPCVADWDKDGVNDLIVGAGDGSVWFYRNIGTAKEPKLEKGVQLVPPGNMEYDVAKMSSTATRGSRSKVCVADVNGDGLPDLLLGDFTTQKPEEKPLTDEEKKKRAEAKAAMTKGNEEYYKLVRKLSGPNREKDPEKMKKLVEDLKALQTKMAELQKVAGAEYDNHGWIWLFVRKAEKAGR